MMEIPRATILARAEDDVDRSLEVAEQALQAALEGRVRERAAAAL